MIGLTDYVSVPPQVLAAVSGSAISLFGDESTLSFVTNSTVVAVVVFAIVFLLARKGTKNMQLIPHPAQNFFESLVEGLYSKIADILGEKVATKAFPLLGTMFIFILVANLLGLVPGIGTVGWGSGEGFLSVNHMDAPLLRPPTADLNMTLGIAVVFMITWFWISIREVGVGGFLKHMFGAKGGMKGIIGLFLSLVFFVVGLIEVVSIVFRPMSLSLRLYGNVFAGETLLHTAMTMLDGKGAFLEMLGAILIPLPFYFLEILIGVLQAVVFTLLCTLYIKLSTTHDEEHDESHGEAH